jgi:hypothetical protein
MTCRTDRRGGSAGSARSGRCCPRLRVSLRSLSTAKARELASKQCDALGTWFRRAAGAGDRIDAAQIAPDLLPTVAARLAQPVDDLTIGDPGKRRGPTLRADSRIMPGRHRGRVRKKLHCTPPCTPPQSLAHPPVRSASPCAEQPRRARGRSHLPAAETRQRVSVGRRCQHLSSEVTPKRRESQLLFQILTETRRSPGAVFDRLTSKAHISETGTNRYRLRVPIAGSISVGRDRLVRIVGLGRLGR